MSLFLLASCHCLRNLKRQYFYCEVSMQCIWLLAHWINSGFNFLHIFTSLCLLTHFLNLLVLFSPGNTFPLVWILGTCELCTLQIMIAKSGWIYTKVENASKVLYMNEWRLCIWSYKACHLWEKQNTFRSLISCSFFGNKDNDFIIFDP